MQDRYGNWHPVNKDALAALSAIAAELEELREQPTVLKEAGIALRAVKAERDRYKEALERIEQATYPRGGMQKNSDSPHHIARAALAAPLDPEVAKWAGRKMAGYPESEMSLIPKNRGEVTSQPVAQSEEEPT